jgi:UDP-2,3-diacylglucosamine pyrophosphatase LpxH
MSKRNRRDRIHARTVWISDVHLGFRGCSAELLLEFLRRIECERLYLVGDIIDIWSMKRRPYWPQSHNNVVRTILGLAKHGTQVVFVPGNHDELLRDYAGMRFGNIAIEHEAVHRGADGRRYLVLHGDKFDSVVRCSKLIALVGSSLYGLLLALNVWVNRVRRTVGWPYWSLSAFVKYRVKNAVQYICNFEEAVLFEARRRGVDGVICGHIHHAEVRQTQGITYCNCGDWVESCTALVEGQDGRIEILRWAEHVAQEADEKVRVAA